MKKRVLMIDNDQDFLMVRKERLEEAGYHVLTAMTLEEGRDTLRSRYIHLALVDVRMVNDDSPKDMTGLDFVREPEFAHIVKIILTGRHKVLSDVSDVMKGKPDPHALPDAVYYLQKDEGWQKMLDVIAQALKDYSGINWSLDLRWPTPAFDVDLAGRLGDAPRDEWPERGEELADLLAMVFYEYQRADVKTLIWHNNQRLALAVTVERDDQKVDRVVVIGRRAAMERVATVRRLMAERAPEGHAQLIKTPRPLRTLHYAAELFELPGASLDDARTLRRFYADNARPAILGSCLRGLAALNLSSDGAEFAPVDQHVDDLLRAHAGMTADTPDALRRRIFAVGEAAARAREATVHLTDGLMTIRSRGKDFQTPNPAGWLSLPGPAEFTKPLLVGDSYGAPLPDAVLVAADGRSWLTDYSHSGRGPLLSTLADLEAQALYDLHSFSNLTQFAGVEAQLLKAGDLAHHLESLGYDKRPFTVIQHVRRQADHYEGDIEAYYRALFYHTVRRLLAMPPDGPVLAALSACLGLGLLAERLTDPPTGEPHNIDQPGLWIDEVKRQVWLDGRLVRPALAEQPYRFLLYLWHHPRERCKNSDIIAHGVARNPDDTYVPNYAPVLARTVRQALGPQAGRYLVNERGAYILYPDGNPDA